MRHAQEAHERADAVLRQQDVEARLRERQRRRERLEARIATLREDFEASEAEDSMRAAEQQRRIEVLRGDRREMARRRGADAVTQPPKST